MDKEIVELAERELAKAQAEMANDRYLEAAERLRAVLEALIVEAKMEV
jgi:hypothetical protein